MNTTLLSVGIDIGTTTTQVVFSRLVMENVAGAFSVPRVEIVDKRVEYRGAIHLTPLLPHNRLDADALHAIVKGEYAKAGVAPGDTDTGAVIITGEAVRKENARLVLDMTSGFAGDFVVSSAGPDLESIIAGKGSGAAAHSRQNNCVVANLDIGGGTTNIAVFASGEVAAVGCYDVGGRQIRVTADGAVEYVSASAALAAEKAGVTIAVGDRANPAAVRRVAEVMNGLLEQALGLSPAEALLERIATAGSSRLRMPPGLDAICFSGGVADCVYRPMAEPFPFGDMGAILGRAIADGKLPRCARLIVPGETIRATVVGAGSYATTVSGSTVSCADGVLPRKNLPVLRLTPDEEDALYRGDREPLAARVDGFFRQNGGYPALGLRGLRNPEYDEVRRAGAALAAVMDERLDFAAPVFVAVERDMAKALGRCIEDSLGGKRPVACIDGVSLADGDFLDMGAPVMGGMAVPIVVKTLVFG